MMKYMLMIGLWSISMLASAQNTYSSAKDSDPKAKAILDKVKKQYDSYKTMEVSFEMELELPGQSKEIQKGTVIQDGSKYNVKMQDQEIYADGKTVWIYLKKNKEVQITDMDDSESSDMISPKQMMRLYENGQYAYTIVDERNEGTKQLVEIEFKPLAKRSEYTKMRLIVDKKTNKMVSLRVYSRDGSKYILKVNNILSNKKYDPSLFVFNTKAVSGVHIEDLRID